MNILVIGGMHGNEPLGIAVVNLLKQKPLKNVDAVLANAQAIADNRRFVKQDLNRSFPGKATSQVYEEIRAAELLELTKQHDIVFDFHNTHCPDNDCGFVGEGAKQMLFDTASFLRLKRVIVADYDCVNKYAPNCLSVEVSLDSSLNQANIWYELIRKLSLVKQLQSAEDIDKFRFVYRLTLDDKDRLNLPNKSLRAFKPISASLAKALGVKSPAYPIFVNDKYTPYNYGGLLNRID